VSEMRCGLIGCGYFADNHLHAWREVEDVQVMAVCDADVSRAHSAAERFRVPHVYADAASMLREQRLDFVDIVTGPQSHRSLVELAAGAGVHVICQKPLAPTLADARAAVAACNSAGVRFMVHENFRWQAPMRALKAEAERTGCPFFGRISFRSAFDVYARQPYLAKDERFIIYDLGVHLLDLARFFIGEFDSVYCRVQRVHPSIRGEDVATIVLTGRAGATCVVDMSYASQLERELFPQTLVQLESREGSATLAADYEIIVRDSDGAHRRHAAPDKHSWSNPTAAAIQDSIVAIHRHWATCLRSGTGPETSGDDNLRTLGLVFDAYRSAEAGAVVPVTER
jgi:D-apiose dehydrogenase